MPPNLRLLENLSPAEMIARAAGNLRDFLTTYGDTLLLCLDVTGESELEAALVMASASSQPEVAAMGFHTALASEHHLLPPAEAAYNATHLTARLSKGRYFVVPLLKRSGGGSHSDRVTVGRARNVDVVLRHASVSKFHAWFERAPDGSLMMADAGSKNGSTLNGNALSPREAKAIKSGDGVTFGGVEGLVVDPKVFHDALKSG